MKVKKCSIIAHRANFGKEIDCKEFLANKKWSNGYKCRKCSHPHFVKGRLHLDRKCQKCKHNESPTSGTLFHSMKLSLVKAFEIIYRISVNKKGLSAISTAREYDVNQKTACRIREKIQLAMTSSESHPLLGEVHVDEFFVGGPEENKQGRTTDSKKKKATVVVEILPDNKGIGRIYAMQIEDFSSTSLRKIFDVHIDKSTLVVADGWRGYNPLKEAYPNLVQKKSENGKAFPKLHLMIMNLKSWMKGIHHRISPARFQQYLNEFTYRFNRRAFIGTIATNLIAKMCNTTRKIPTKKEPNKLKLVA